MNKCLVTTLKAHTNNEALSKYNVLTIKIKASDSYNANTQWLSIITSNNGSISINSPSVGLYQSMISGELLPYPFTIGANEEHEYFFENKDGVIEITNKYNLKQIGVGYNGTVRIKEIYGLTPNTITFIQSYIEENEIDATKLINIINRSNVTNISILGGKNVINKLSKNIINELNSITIVSSSFCSLFDNIGLDDFSNCVNISIMECNIKGGNLSSLAKMTKLNSIAFFNNQNNGDIMDFINPWIQAGRTSGRIKVFNLNQQQNITLNGSPISFPSEIPNFANVYINWTSDGTVTFTAG